MLARLDEANRFARQLERSSAQWRAATETVTPLWVEQRQAIQFAASLAAQRRRIEEMFAPLNTQFGFAAKLAPMITRAESDARLLAKFDTQKLRAGAAARYLSPVEPVKLPPPPAARTNELLGDLQGTVCELHESLERERREARERDEARDARHRDEIEEERRARCKSHRIAVVSIVVGSMIGLLGILVSVATLVFTAQP